MVLWNLECPGGLTQKEYVRISVKEICRNLDGLPKINSGATKCFDLVGRKQIKQLAPNVYIKSL